MNSPPSPLPCASESALILFNSSTCCHCRLCLLSKERKELSDSEKTARTATSYSLQKEQGSLTLPGPKRQAAWRKRFKAHKYQRTSGVLGAEGTILNTVKHK